MIASLSGRRRAGEADSAVIDVGGIGYRVQCSTRTLEALPAPGEPTELLIETHMREDAIHLYGFADATERAWFRLLIKVQGVGARMALGILSALAPHDLATAIAAQDGAPLRRVSGIGPKVAGRIVGELKDHAGSMAQVTPLPRPANGGSAHDGDSVAAEAVSALINLGYGRSEAHAAVAGAGAGDLASLIRNGLKALSAP